MRRNWRRGKELSDGGKDENMFREKKRESGKVSTRNSELE